MPWYRAFCCFKQKTAYEMRISDWSSDVCSSDLDDDRLQLGFAHRLPSSAPVGGYGGGEPVANFLAEGGLVADLRENVERPAHHAASSMSAMRSSRIVRVPNRTSLSLPRLR